jgi:hypothetical protein
VSSPNQWFLPNQYASDPVPLSPGFDILGRDLPLANLDDSIFCAHVRLTALDTQGLMRLDVRVLWTRGIVTSASPSAPTGVCQPNVATDPRPNPATYHAVYVTTAVRGNPI